MRPVGKKDTDSLYFRYPHFDPPDRSSQSVPSEVEAVVVVGAGPVGLTSALALAKHGVRSVVLDDKNTFNDGSRAICVARPSFYILEQVGAVAPFLKKALGWTTGRSFFRGKQILEFHMPDSPDEKYRPMYNLQQQYIEQFLWQAAQANDHIEMRWQSTVTGIENSASGAAVSVRDPSGEYTLEANYVLACDGARSTIRGLRGKRLQGESFEGRYVIADIQMVHDYPTIRRALFDPPSRPGGTVLVHKQPDDIWRVDYQLDDDESTKEAMDEQTIRENIDSVLRDLDYDGPWELEWWSVYSANTLALDNYRDGPVFFVGDSAHIVPIFGVRGLNNGFADAANIGWKLGWVLTGKADEGLLETYSPERRGATLDVFANASKSAQFMTPRSYGWKLMRDAALSLAVTHPFAGELANPRQMTAFTYQGSGAVLEDDPRFSGGPSVGALMPDAQLADGFLSDVLGNSFTVLCFDQQLAQRVANDCPEGLTAAVVTLPLPSKVADQFSASKSTAYLIRPDMHIAGRWYKAAPWHIIEGMQQIAYPAESKHESH